MGRPGISAGCARSDIVHFDAVIKALRLEDFDSSSAQLLMAPRPRDFFRPQTMAQKPRQAGVLLFFFEKDDELNFTLTRRTETLGNHSGQISFPGGARDGGETLLETALRETHEELGILLDVSNIIGRLAPLYISSSDYKMYPYVALLSFFPLFASAQTEVAEIINVPVARLLDPTAHQEETREIRGHQILVPYYLLNGHKVWGATAIVLSELEQRLRKAIGPSSTEDWEN